MPIPVAAGMLGLSRPRLYAIARDGTLSVSKMGGAVYVTIKSVRRYQKSHAVPTGLILMNDAQEEFHYSRPKLWQWVKSGAIRKKIVGRRACLYRTDFEKLCRAPEPAGRAKKKPTS